MTFENREKCFRASFLIRGYSVYSLINHEWVRTKNHEARPTYLYEDFARAKRQTSIGFESIQK